MNISKVLQDLLMNIRPNVNQLSEVTKVLHESGIDPSGCFISSKFDHKNGIHIAISQKLNVSNMLDDGEDNDRKKRAIIKKIMSIAGENIIRVSDDVVNIFFEFLQKKMKDENIDLRAGSVTKNALKEKGDIIKKVIKRLPQNDYLRTAVILKAIIEKKDTDIKGVKQSTKYNWRFGSVLLPHIRYFPELMNKRLITSLTPNIKESSNNRHKLYQQENDFTMSMDLTALIFAIGTTTATNPSWLKSDTIGDAFERFVSEKVLPTMSRSTLETKNISRISPIIMYYNKIETLTVENYKSASFPRYSFKPKNKVPMSIDKIVITSEVLKTINLSCKTLKELDLTKCDNIEEIELHIKTDGPLLVKTSKSSNLIRLTINEIDYYSSDESIGLVWEGSRYQHTSSPLVILESLVLGNEDVFKSQFSSTNSMTIVKQFRKEYKKMSGKYSELLLRTEDYQKFVKDDKNKTKTPQGNSNYTGISSIKPPPERPSIATPPDVISNHTGKPDQKTPPGQNYIKTPGENPETPYRNPSYNGATAPGNSSYNYVTPLGNYNYNDGSSSRTPKSMNSSMVSGSSQQPSVINKGNSLSPYSDNLNNTENTSENDDLASPSKIFENVGGIYPRIEYKDDKLFFISSKNSSQKRKLVEMTPDQLIEYANKQKKKEKQKKKNKKQKTGAKRAMIMELDIKPNELNDTIRQLTTVYEMDFEAQKSLKTSVQQEILKMFGLESIPLELINWSNDNKENDKIIKKIEEFFVDQKAKTGYGVAYRAKRDLKKINGDSKKIDHIIKNMEIKHMATKKPTFTSKNVGLILMANDIVRTILAKCFDNKFFTELREYFTLKLIKSKTSSEKQTVDKNKASISSNADNVNVYDVLLDSSKGYQFTLAFFLNPEKVLKAIIPEKGRVRLLTVRLFDYVDITSLCAFFSPLELHVKKSNHTFTSETKRLIKTKVVFIFSKSVIVDLSKFSSLVNLNINNVSNMKDSDKKDTAFEKYDILIRAFPKSKIETITLGKINSFAKVFSTLIKSVSKKLVLILEQDIKKYKISSREIASLKNSKIEVIVNGKDWNKVNKNTDEDMVDN